MQKKKMNLKPLHHKQLTQNIINLNVRSKITKLLGEKNLRENLSDLGLGKDFLNMTQKHEL